MPTVVETDGNPTCHVILRGANSGPNFSAEHISKCAASLTKAKLLPKVMIDWYVKRMRMYLSQADYFFLDSSHGNSEKKHEKQVGVAESVAQQLGEKETAENIMGVMIESHLVAGKQSIPADLSALTYGQSVT